MASPPAGGSPADASSLSRGVGYVLSVPVTQLSTSLDAAEPLFAPSVRALSQLSRSERLPAAVRSSLRERAVEVTRAWGARGGSAPIRTGRATRAAIHLLALCADLGVAPPTALRPRIDDALSHLGEAELLGFDAARAARAHTTWSDAVDPPAGAPAAFDDLAPFADAAATLPSAAALGISGSALSAPTLIRLLPALRPYAGPGSLGRYLNQTRALDSLVGSLVGGGQLRGLLTEGVLEPERRYLLNALVLAAVRRAPPPDPAGSRALSPDRLRPRRSTWAAPTSPRVFCPRVTRSDSAQTI